MYCRLSYFSRGKVTEMAEQYVKNMQKHKLTIDNREKLVATGVLKVDFCSDEMIIAQTDIGQVNVKGSNLHIENLSADSGELLVEGNIVAVSYSKAGGTDSFFGKLFK